MTDPIHSEEQSTALTEAGPVSSTPFERAPRDPATVRQRRFFQSVLVAGIGVLGYYAYTAKVADVVHLYQGLVILVLAILPAVLWARNPRQQFPTFEAFFLTLCNSYAIPLLSGHVQLTGYPPDVLTEAASAVILFQICALVMFYLTRGRPPRSAFWRHEVFPTSAGRYLGYAMVLNSIYVVMSTYFQAIPPDLIGPLRAVFFGIGIVCTFLQTLRWGQRTLGRGEKIYFLINFALQVIVLTSTLYLINAIALLLLGLAGYVSGARRIPIVTCLTVFLVLAVLHNGKFAMRAKYWENAETSERHDTLLALPQFYAEWFENGLKLTAADENERVAHKLLERTSLFHIMALVVQQTPLYLPYLAGETYKDIPGQFVPRFFWPDKPLGHVSTYRLAIYYGLQTVETTATTTIGFGVLAEAYANFGFIGVAGLGGFIGFMLRKIRLWCAESPMLSYPGIFTVLLMSWCFATEMTLSMWLSSLYQACVAVLGTILLVRRIFG